MRASFGIAIWLAAAAAAAMLPSCSGTARRGEPLRATPDIDSPAVAHGRIVFARECHHCHPGGAGGLGPAINDKPLPSFLIRFQVRHGLGAMPSFSEEEISGEDLADVIAYLRSLRRADERAGTELAAAGGRPGWR